MDPGSFAIVLIRLIIPATILKYPLGGFLAAYLADGLHLALVDIVNQAFGFHGIAWAGPQNYHLIDKPLDLYFLTFGMIAVYRWGNQSLNQILIILYSLRLAGTVAFVLTLARPSLFFFPNIFEFFYLYTTTSRKWLPNFFPNTTQKIAIAVLLASMLKLPFEYFLHIENLGLGEIIDQFTPINFPHQTIWGWFRHNALS